MMGEFVFGLGLGLIVGSGCTWMYYDWKLQVYDYDRKLDREELLREVEAKAIRWAEGRDIAQITARLNELEEARASEGKG